MRIVDDQGHRSVEECLPAMSKTQRLITRETETETEERMRRRTERKGNKNMFQILVQKGKPFVCSCGQRRQI